MKLGPNNHICTERLNPLEKQSLELQQKVRKGDISRPDEVMEACRHGAPELDEKRLPLYEKAFARIVQSIETDLAEGKSRVSTGNKVANQVMQDNADIADKYMLTLLASAGAQRLLKREQQKRAKTEHNGAKGITEKQKHISFTCTLTQVMTSIETNLLGTPFQPEIKSEVELVDFFNKRIRCKCLNHYSEELKQKEKEKDKKRVKKDKEGEHSPNHRDSLWKSRRNSSRRLTETTDRHEKGRPSDEKPKTDRRRMAPARSRSMDSSIELLMRPKTPSRENSGSKAPSRTTNMTLRPKTPSRSSSSRSADGRPKPPVRSTSMIALTRSEHRSKTPSRNTMVPTRRSKTPSRNASMTATSRPKTPSMSTSITAVTRPKTPSPFDALVQLETTSRAPSRSSSGRLRARSQSRGRVPLRSKSCELLPLSRENSSKEKILSDWEHSSHWSLEKKTMVLDRPWPSRNLMSETGETRKAVVETSSNHEEKPRESSYGVVTPPKPTRSKTVTRASSSRNLKKESATEKAVSKASSNHEKKTNVVPGKIPVHPVQEEDAELKSDHVVQSKKQETDASAREKSKQEEEQNDEDELHCKATDSCASTVNSEQDIDELENADSVFNQQLKEESQQYGYQVTKYASFEMTGQHSTGGRAVHIAPHKNRMTKCSCRDCEVYRPLFKFTACAGCHSVFYCNAGCQRKHWKYHSEECEKLKRAKEEASYPAS